MRTYLIKCYSKILPTLEHQMKRHPKVYQNDTCPRCQQSQETFSHLWECTQSINIINKIHQKAPKKLQQLINDHDNHTSILNIQVFINNLLSQQNTLTSTIQIGRKIQPQEIYSGIVPHLLTQFINIYNIDIKQARVIVSKFVIWISNKTRKKIWISRCKILINHQNTHNITSKQKKQKSNNKRGRPLNSTLNSTVKTKYKVWLHPNLCECEHLNEDHIDNLCPQSYRMIKTGDLITEATLKLQSYTELLTDPVTPV